jgi:hypothetical protein
MASNDGHTTTDKRAMVGEMHEESTNTFIGPGMVSTPGQTKGLVVGSAAGTGIGLLAGVLAGIVVALVASGPTLMWIALCAVAGALAGATFGFIFGGSVGPAVTGEPVDSFVYGDMEGRDLRGNEGARDVHEGRRPV